MPFNAIVCAGIAAAFAVLFVSSATATGDNAARLHRRHSVRLLHYRVDRPKLVATGSALPYRPEYGFLSRVPPDAIRMPGYTFVPGVGILGASCDLPTSACSNQYRDIQ
jgi:hypothetical protein